MNFFLVWFRDNTTGDAWPCKAYDTHAAAQHHIAQGTDLWQRRLNGEPIEELPTCYCTEDTARIHEMRTE